MRAVENRHFTLFVGLNIVDNQDVRRRIGVRLEGDGDQPLIKSVDSAIEKAVTTVINAAIKEANAEA